MRPARLTSGFIPAARNNSKRQDLPPAGQVGVARRTALVP